MDKIEIRYCLLSLVESFYKFNFDYDYSSLDSSKINCQISHSIDPIMNDDKLVINCGVRYVIGNDVVLCENHARTVFQVTPLDKAFSVDSDGKCHTSEIHLANTLYTVCIGGLRGFLVKNLKGTPLDGVVLPLVPLPFKK